jgi:hypothetical protein
LRMCAEVKPKQAGRKCPIRPMISRTNSWRAIARIAWVLGSATGHGPAPRHVPMSRQQSSNMLWQWPIDNTRLQAEAPGLPTSTKTYWEGWHGCAPSPSRGRCACLQSNREQACPCSPPPLSPTHSCTSLHQPAHLVACYLTASMAQIRPVQLPTRPTNCATPHQHGLLPFSLLPQLCVSRAILSSFDRGLSTRTFDLTIDACGSSPHRLHSHAQHPPPHMIGRNPPPQLWNASRRQVGHLWLAACPRARSMLPRLGTGGRRGSPGEIEIRVSWCHALAGNLPRSSMRSFMAACARAGVGKAQLPLACFARPNGGASHERFQNPFARAELANQPCRPCITVWARRARAWGTSRRYRNGEGAAIPSAMAPAATPRPQVLR